MTGISRTEAAMIRSQLALRYNPKLNCHEVYTTIHGTGVFRWMHCTEDNYQWYIDNFPNITILPYVETANENIPSSTSAVLPSSQLPQIHPA